MDTYEPNQDRQLVVIASPANMQDVSARLGEMFEASDFDSVFSDTGKEKRQEALEGYMAGNLFALALSSDVAISRSFELSRPPAVLVNFDAPSSMPLHLYRLLLRAGAATRIHSFVSPSSDHGFAVPLMAALEDAGHEIPSGLMELWSKPDEPTLDEGE